MADSFDYLRYLEPAPERGDRFAAEADLLRSLPAKTADGVVARVQEFQEDPLKFGLMMGSAATIGAAFSLLGRSRNHGSTAIACIPKLMGLAAATDIGMRVGFPAINTFLDPYHREKYQKELGDNLGGLIVDYSAMGLAGLAGARTMTKLPRGAFGQSALSDDIPGFARAVRDNLQRPKQLAALEFDTQVEAGLKRADDGYRAPKQLKQAVKELNVSMETLRRGMSSYLQERQLAPKVGVGWSYNDDTLGASYCWKAKVDFDAKFTAKKPAPAMADLVGHEYTHVEQDVLKVRRLADILGLSREPGKADLSRLTKEIQKIHPNETVDPTISYLRSIMKLRDGAPLNTAQAARADRLLAETPDYRIAMQDKERYKTLTNAINNWDSKKLKIAKELRNPENVKFYFKDQNLSPELKAVIDEIGKPGSDATKFEVLRRALVAEQEPARVRRDAGNAVYRSSLCEIEANTIGARVAWQYVLDSRRMTPLLMTGIPSLIDGGMGFGSLFQHHGLDRDLDHRLDLLLLEQKYSGEGRIIYDFRRPSSPTVRWEKWYRDETTPSELKDKTAVRSEPSEFPNRNK